MRSILPALLSLLLIAACGRADDDDSSGPNAQALDLTTQLYTDINAQPTRQPSGQIEDFQQEVWEPWVHNLFTPLDTAVLPQSDAIRDSLLFVHFFPNPAQQTQHFGWSPGDTVNVKLVMVNHLRQPLFRTSKTFYHQYSHLISLAYDQMNLPDRDSLYRMYFAFSTQSRPYFYTSHADITVQR